MTVLSLNFLDSRRRAGIPGLSVMVVLHCLLSCPVTTDMWACLLSNGYRREPTLYHGIKYQPWTGKRCSLFARYLACMRACVYLVQVHVRFALYNLYNRVASCLPIM